MIELNLAIIGLIFSILFSSSEIALISANKLQIDVWIKQRYVYSKNAKNILNNKASYLNVSLIGTNLSNILASSFFTLYFINLIETNKSYFISEEFIFFPIARPSPVPCSPPVGIELSFLKGLNSFSSSSLFIPGPSSLTDTLTHPLPGSAVISITPPIGENFIAFVKRLSNTCPILGASNKNTGMSW